MPEPAPTSIRPQPALDPRFSPLPIVRQAWTLICPRKGSAMTGRITILEMKDGGRVTLQETDGTVERSVDLNVVELRALADHAQRIARRVATRPERRP